MSFSDLLQNLRFPHPGSNRGMASHKVFIRFFEKFDLAKNRVVFTPFYQWFFDNLKFDNFTLDLDSSVIKFFLDNVSDCLYKSLPVSEEFIS